jgi:hypothetical protein
MRLSELVGMNLNDIDLSLRQIRLFGKGHKERMVYLNDACMDALQLYLEKRNTLEGLLPDEKAVFITRRLKTRISNRRVEQLITGAMKAAGLKGFSTHKLRHTAATLMYQTGQVDILVLKELLGHSNLSTTQIYTHLNGVQVRSAVEANPLGMMKSGKKAEAAENASNGDDVDASMQNTPEPTADPADHAKLAEQAGIGLETFDHMLYTTYDGGEKNAEEEPLQHEN